MRRPGAAAYSPGKLGDTYQADAPSQTKAGSSVSVYGERRVRREALRRLTGTAGIALLTAR